MRVSNTVIIRAVGVASCSLIIIIQAGVLGAPSWYNAGRVAGAGIALFIVVTFAIDLGRKLGHAELIEYLEASKDPVPISILWEKATGIGGDLFSLEDIPAPVPLEATDTTTHPPIEGSRGWSDAELEALRKEYSQPNMTHEKLGAIHGVSGRRIGQLLERTGARRTASPFPTVASARHRSQ